MKEGFESIYKQENEKNDEFLKNVARDLIAKGIYTGDGWSCESEDQLWNCISHDYEIKVKKGDIIFSDENKSLFEALPEDEKGEVSGNYEGSNINMTFYHKKASRDYSYSINFKSLDELKQFVGWDKNEPDWYFARYRKEK